MVVEDVDVASDDSDARHDASPDRCDCLRERVPWEINTSSSTVSGLNTTLTSIGSLLKGRLFASSDVAQLPRFVVAAPRACPQISWVSLSSERLRLIQLLIRCSKTVREDFRTSLLRCFAKWSAVAGVLLVFALSGTTPVEREMRRKEVSTAVSVSARSGLEAVQSTIGDKLPSTFSTARTPNARRIPIRYSRTMRVDEKCS